MTPLAATEAERLEPCPFCKCAMRIDSNRDWHHLTGEHDDLCPFDSDDDTMCVPADPSSLAWMHESWNRRASQQSAAQATAEPFAWVWDTSLGPECTKDTELVEYYKRKGRNVQPVYLAAPSPAPMPDEKAEHVDVVAKIHIHREGNRFWHQNCTNHLGGIMKVMSHDGAKSLIVCLHCGKHGHYPVGGVGTVCSEDVTPAAPDRAPSTESLTDAQIDVLMARVMPGTRPSACFRKFARLVAEQVICGLCNLPRTVCGCVPTDDGPGQQGAAPDVEIEKKGTEDANAK